MPVTDLFGETREPATHPEIYCEPGHYPHLVTTGLFVCTQCRAWHHHGYRCTATAPVRHLGDPPGEEPREWCEQCDGYRDDDGDCPHALIQCGDCDSEHERDEDCPRGWCADCDYWHERDRWGDITCPGWYCDDCGTEHDHGEDCPNPYCEDCEEYHSRDEPCAADCCCESPRQSFAIRNDGEPPLASDTRATIRLPAADEISAEGLKAIREYLIQIYRRERNAGNDANAKLYNLAYAFEDAIGIKWQTRDGNYTKRLSRLAYKNYGVKLTPEIMSQVGCIARDHSTSAVSFDIEVTRDLNQSPDEFANGDSCWWGGMSESRCALKTNGGFGLRSFGPLRWGGDGVTGRAWVLPLRLDELGEWEPTFDTETPDAFAVFNGYGDLSGYAPARIMALMAGWTYKKTSFSCTPMYINAGCYLVAPEQVIQDAGNGLRLSVDQHANLTEREMAHAA